MQQEIKGDKIWLPANENGDFEQKACGDLSIQAFAFHSNHGLGSPLSSNQFNQCTAWGTNVDWCYGS